jgi:hypothetical protein
MSGPCAQDKGILRCLLDSAHLHVLHWYFHLSTPLRMGRFYACREVQSEKNSIPKTLLRIASSLLPDSNVHAEIYLFEPLCYSFSPTAPLPQLPRYL